MYFEHKVNASLFKADLIKPLVIKAPSKIEQLIAELNDLASTKDKLEAANKRIAELEERASKYEEYTEVRLNNIAKLEDELALARKINQLYCSLLHVETGKRYMPEVTVVGKLWPGDGKARNIRLVVKD